jgi:uncharacterized iron-regulated membrane protein
MLTARKVRHWYRVHKWTSLICTAFLLVSCLTGLPMIFSDEIFDLTHHHVRAAAVPPNTPLANLDNIVAIGAHHFPSDKIISLGFDDDEPRIFLNVSPNYKPEAGDIHTMIFDAHTGKLLEEPKESRDFMSYVVMLHIQLYAGLAGELFLGCMALLFVVALVSGAVVYGPFMRRLDFGTVRKGKVRRVQWFDLHNLLGIVTLSWAFVVGATGVMNTLSTPLFGLWRAQTLPKLLAPYHGKPVPAQFTSVDAALDTAQRALPGMEVTGIVFPNPILSSPRHYVIWTKGKTPVTSRLFTPALVDVENGQLTTAKGLPWYLRALEVSRPLHFGDYGGIPLKIIWALFDLSLVLVLISGLYLWLSRRKTPVEKELDRLVSLEELPQAVPETGAMAR